MVLMITLLVALTGQHFQEISIVVPAKAKASSVERQKADHPCPVEARETSRRPYKADEMLVL